MDLTTGSVEHSNIRTADRKTITIWLNNTGDEYTLIFYCDKLHCCHNIAIMIKESITSMLAYYRRIDITELILQN